MNRLKLTAGISSLALGLLLAAAPAGAQVYNPGTTTTSTSTTSTTVAGATTTTLPGATTTAPPTTSSPTTAAPAGGNQNGGTHVKGETFSNQLCGYQPGATVTLSVDGQAGPSATADGNGCVTVQVTIVDNSHVRVNGVTFNAACGPNSVITTGPGANGSTLSETDSFTINCGTAATPTSSNGGGLAFTGANILKLSGAALLLILFGAALVAAERRRSRLQG